MAKNIKATQTQSGKRLVFAATNKIGAEIVSTPREYDQGSYISWGAHNDYPNKIYESYLGSPTLQSVVDGITMYVSDGIGAHLDKIAFQLTLYGAFALRYAYNEDGEVVYEVLDWRYIRYTSDKKAVKYSEGFGNPYAKDRSVKTYQLYNPAETRFQNKGRVVIGRRAPFQTYPIPPIGSALIAAECEQEIARFHLTSIRRGFVASTIVNFNNGGYLNDEQKAEIERDFDEKFCGAENAGTMMISFNDSKETEATVASVPVAELGDKYATLANNVRQQIFTAFRVNPNIFGLPTEGTGFSGEEYAQSFALFAANVVAPARRLITQVLKGIGVNIIFNPLEKISDE